MPFSACSVPHLAGQLLTTEAKISSDMPLPMPRWVIELAHPHEQGGAGGEGEHDERARGTA